LFRSAQPSSSADEGLRVEVGEIFAHSLREGALNADDRDYVANMVAAKTGLSRSDAEKRVDEVFGKDQQAVDNARKAVAHSLYWMFVALLLGAFTASVSATFGGKQRDRVRV
jgi:hypothetical protein